jgi:hypothetical protein
MFQQSDIYFLINSLTVGTLYYFIFQERKAIKFEIGNIIFSLGLFLIFNWLRLSSEMYRELK